MKFHKYKDFFYTIKFKAMLNGLESEKLMGLRYVIFLVKIITYLKCVCPDDLYRIQVLFSFYLSENISLIWAFVKPFL